MKAAISSSLDPDPGQEQTPVLPANSREHQRVRRIANRLLHAAEMLLEERVAAIKAEGANAGVQTLATDREANDWVSALQRLQSGKWTVVLVNNSSPNAYVTPLVPRHIFVHKGMLGKHVQATDSALAFVLGHEISHTLLAHGEESLYTQLGIMVGSLAAVASLDPTGVLSLGVEVCLHQMLKYAIALPFSRHHEAEADALGMEICAKACYNPQGAHAFFDALAKIEERFGGGANGWTTTHPRTSHRDHAAVEHAQTALVQQYLDHCVFAAADVKKKLRLSALSAAAQSSSMLPGVPGSFKSRAGDLRLAVKVSRTHSSGKGPVDIYWVDYNGEPQLWTSLTSDEEAACLPISGACFAVVDPHSHEALACFTATAAGVTWARDDARVLARGWRATPPPVQVHCAPLALEEGDYVRFAAQGSSQTWQQARVVGAGRRAGQYRLAPIAGGTVMLSDVVTVPTSRIHPSGIGDRVPASSVAPGTKVLVRGPPAVETNGGVSHGIGWIPAQVVKSGSDHCHVRLGFDCGMGKSGDICSVATEQLRLQDTRPAF